ncbi:hypothetical protein GCM10011379_13690 [Filimonas zeae]|uniref:HTH araC/xylS-type domain-containing protein n=1 Tax=Filimonas zeae TaxID=1737353 RepID=A0A917MVI1_9BACT|nr:hypothetical protein GCM10011379_13690 [Filimonas zeae]
MLLIFILNTIQVTYYHAEITRIKQICYANKGQIDTVIETRRYITKHFDEAISLELLSHKQFTSKFHLLRLFKKYYGQTPQQYLADRRIEKAKEFLSTGLSVTAVCFNIGFESPASFCTFFKARVGVNPAEFRKRAILTKSE